MKRTQFVIAFLVLGTNPAAAQPLTSPPTAGPLFGTAEVGGADGAISSRDARSHIAVPTFGSPKSLRAALGSGSRGAATSATPAGLRSSIIDFRLRSSAGVTASTLTLGTDRMFSQLTFETHKRPESDIDWIGLARQQTRVDGVMHAIRLQQRKFHEPLYHSAFFPGYREALKGYFSLPLRWDDGDDFVTNDINHPIMGALFTHTFTDYDRRCSNMVFGEAGYWSCIKRATLYAGVASANWEWNPLMSESALGHIGKFRTCRGRCQGEGGWTDLVMTPLGGLGVRIAGDLARTRLWPVLDRNLSGSTLAKALNYTVKTLTAPSHFLNCAFKLDFKNAWKPTASSSGQSRMTRPGK